MQSLADMLHINREVASEWHALAAMERLLAPSTVSLLVQPSSDPAALLSAWRRLAACARPRRPYYAAQLLLALDQPALAMRALQASALFAAQSPGAADVDLQVRL